MANSGVISYIALGSNIGEREENLDTAIDLLHHAESIEVKGVSAYYNTAPVGYINQPDFLNAVVAVKTVLDPHALLEICQDIEKKLKRIRTIRWGPRIIDVDILLYGDKVIDDTELTIPHPRMHERDFVLTPLCDIAPEVIHPVLGVTMDELRKKN